MPEPEEDVAPPEIPQEQVDPLSLPGMTKKDLAGWSQVIGRWV